jgi:DNA-binding response OmpR family regulator
MRARANTHTRQVSANTDEDNVLKGFKAGSNDFVKKPFSRAEVLARYAFSSLSSPSSLSPHPSPPPLLPSSLSLFYSLSSPPPSP